MEKNLLNLDIVESPFPADSDTVCKGVRSICLKVVEIDLNVGRYT